MIKGFNKKLIENNDSLLLALSGGIDSMVMLDIIEKLKNEMNLKLYIAHVDHQKRISSKDDRDFVVETANELNIPCFVESLEGDYDDNFHDYAHKKRYDFFYKVAKDNNINKIVLAHNANDNAETILMRLNRGSSFEGYRGILEKAEYKGIKIIRPLLQVSRSDIEVYQQANLIPYQNDPSNDMDDYTRNRYRHHLLPILENENPKFLEKFAQFSYYQTLSYELIESISEAFLSKLVFDDKIVIKIKDILNNQQIIQIELIKRIINRLTDNKVELSFQNILDILNLINNEKPHVEFEIENKIYLYKSYDNIVFQTSKYQPIEYNELIDNYKEISLPNGYLVDITKNANKNYGFLYKLCYNNLDLIFPLSVRNRQDGDKIKLKSGTKKLKDVFIDKKIPKKERDSLPIFLDKTGEIIFIPGIYSKETTGDNELYICVQKG